MNLTGYVMTGHHHHQRDVFPVISAHIVGMYGLVLVVGDLIERIGRRESLVVGPPDHGRLDAQPRLGGERRRHRHRALRARAGLEPQLRRGDDQLVDLAAPGERAQLVGFGDLLSGLSAAALALLGGAAYSAQGVVSLAVGGAVLATLPAVWLAVGPRYRRALEPAA